MDSISAQGITNALRDAEFLADAIVAGLGGAQPLGAALAEHQRRRDAAIRPMYDFTLGLAQFAPSLAGRLLLAALIERPAETDRFLGTFAGVVPINEFLAPSNVLRLLGGRGLLRLAGDALRGILPKRQRHVGQSDANTTELV
jgi:hypothetical protein